MPLTHRATALLLITLLWATLHGIMQGQIKPTQADSLDDEPFSWGNEATV